MGNGRKIIPKHDWRGHKMITGKLKGVEEECERKGTK